jgi:hypothetical protein
MHTGKLAPDHPLKLLRVVDVVDIECLSIGEPKRDAPVARYVDGPFTLSRALQEMQSHARQIKVRWLLRGVQQVKNAGQL